jgi:predicted peroxiredoxin
VQDLLFDEWIHKFKPIADDARAMGVEIVNCTPGSALTCFPTASIEEAL